MFDNLFIQHAFDPDTQFFYGAWIITVVISIVIHELAHGYAAIKQGDQTPILQNRMTGNPLVHMGPFAMIALALIGIAWGQMPIDPTRFKSRYGQAIVAAAGPLANIILAILGLTTLTLFSTFGPTDPSQTTNNLTQFLGVFGTVNIVLCLFNLIPIPPLDGSAILANFNTPYARFIRDPEKQQFIFFAFFVVFMISAPIFTAADTIAAAYTGTLDRLFTLFG